MSQAVDRSGYTNYSSELCAISLDDANSAVTQNYRQNSGVLVILESICRAYIIGVICVARRAQVAMAT